jgi:hypothetical protein
MFDLEELRRWDEALKRLQAARTQRKDAAQVREAEPA